MFSPEGDFVPQETFGKVWWHFGWLQLGMEVYPGI